MVTRLYEPQLGQDFQQGISSLGSLFAPPSSQQLVAQASIAKNQADTASQALARDNIAKGVATPADYATLGVADPTKNYIQGQLFADARAHPNASPSTFDSGVYIMGGDSAKTYTGQQAAPLNADQSRILPPNLAGALGVPQVQHGTIKLGDDSQMLPGAGTQPIASAPDTGDGAPETTDALAAKIVYDEMQRRKAASTGGSVPPQTNDPVVAAALNRMGKGAGSQTTLDMKGEGAEAAESGKLAAQRSNDLMTAADKAPEEIGRIRTLRDVLQRTRTGPLAGPTGTAVAVANSLGITPERLTALGIDPNQAVNNETAQKLSNELVAGSIGAKGGGFPASNFSVAERQFIEKMFPSISSQPGSNEFVSDVLEARGLRTLQKMQDFNAYRRQQQAAGKPISYNDFDGDWQGHHANENIFQPIIDKFNAGGYAPPGAPAPQPGGAVSALPTQQSSVIAGPGGAPPQAMPGSPPVTPPTQGAAPSNVIARARAAIAAGAPRDQVLRRLEQAGVNFSGQGL